MLFRSIHTAFAYPEQFGGAFGLSSAFIINRIKGMKAGMKDDVADYYSYYRVFGDLDKLDTSEVNPEYLIKKLKEEGKKVPPIYLTCGTEDFLIEQNREFRDFLTNEGIFFTYEESKGIHDWKFWNGTLEPAIKWMLNI